MRGTQAKAIRRMVATAYIALRKAKDPTANLPYSKIYRAVKRAFNRGEIKIENQYYRSSRSR